MANGHAKRHRLLLVKLSYNWMRNSNSSKYHTSYYVTDTLYFIASHTRIYSLIVVQIQGNIHARFYRYSLMWIWNFVIYSHLCSLPCYPLLANNDSFAEIIFDPKVGKKSVFNCMHHGQQLAWMCRKLHKLHCFGWKKIAIGGSILHDENVFFIITLLHPKHNLHDIGSLKFLLVLYHDPLNEGDL